MSTVFPRPSNPPDRPTLSYRIATRTDFLDWMLGRLPWQDIPDGPHAGTRPLANLATHSARDPAVALLDAFAVVADVLTFYEERIANEGFLRTAGETRSVMEMARALGYELSPGRAAGAWLAFTVETAPGAPAEVVIDPGVRVLSVPGQDQRPQTFETVERIAARPEWNQLRPVTAVPQGFTHDAAELWVDLVQGNLASGETLLLVSHDREANADSGRWALRTVAGVTPFPASARARIALTPTSGTEAPAPGTGRVFVMNQRAAVFGHNAPDWAAMPESVRTQPKFNGTTDWKDFAVTLTAGGQLLLDTLYPKLLPGTWLALTAGSARGLFWVEAIESIGYSNFTLTARCTAPELLARPGGATANIGSFAGARRGIVVLGQGDELALVDRPLVNDAWGTAILAPFPNVLDDPPADPLDEDDRVALDGVVLGLAAGRTLLVTGKRLRARVVTSAGITLTAETGASASYAQGETLFVVARPLRVPGARRVWRLADAGAFEGTAELVDGDLALEPAAPGDPVVAELAIIKEVIPTPIRTALRFSAPLRAWYDRATTTLAGNVAIATHGETVNEVLGSGDGGQANQRFTLKRAPLTWVPAATPSGRMSTLEIRVDGVRWHEVSSFHDQSANSRVYLSRRDDQGRTAIVFGDGVHGARLPSGLENVVAKYRIGTGLDGEVGAGKIMLFQTRPLGVRAVSNPLPASGAEPPATGAAAKGAVPESVLTLDRVVSLTDYETFAETFAGIGKARAAFLRRGEEQRVHLTLALADGSPVASDAVILGYLRAALDAVRDTTTPVEMAGHGRIWFRAAARLTVATDHLFASVAAAAADAMTEAFSFERRSFGQGISAAEVVALLQGVPGVAAVDLDGLETMADLADQHIPAQVTALLTARDAHWNGDAIVPAQLLLLDPSPRGLTFNDAQEQP